MRVEMAGRLQHHRELHAAGDVHADAVGDHGVADGHDAADGKSVPDMAVGHLRAADGDRQTARVAQLVQGLLVQIRRAPDGVGRGRGTKRPARRGGGGDKRLRSPGEVLVLRESSGVPEDLPESVEDRRGRHAGLLGAPDGVLRDHEELARPTDPLEVLTAHGHWRTPGFG